MATSLESVTLLPKVWKDLYDATSIPVGTKILIQNIGKDEAIVSESVAEPISTTGRNNVNIDAFIASASTPVGVWARSRLGTVLQVEEF